MNLWFTYNLRIDYSSGRRNNIDYPKYPVAGYLAWRLFIRSIDEGCV